MIFLAPLLALFLPVFGILYIACYSIYGIANGRKLTASGYAITAVCVFILVKLAVGWQLCTSSHVCLYLTLLLSVHLLYLDIY